MQFDNPTGTVLYSIDQAIKAYRKLALHNIQQVIPGLTVDQALALWVIHKHPNLTQVEMSKMIFKDFASMTRMIQLMDKKGFLKRKMNPADRRRYLLIITPLGKEAVTALTPIVEQNRRQALAGLSDTDIETLHHLLQKVISNCSTSA